jgi:hypothetical protein
MDRVCLSMITRLVHVNCIVAQRHDTSREDRCHMLTWMRCTSQSIQTADELDGMYTGITLTYARTGQFSHVHGMLVSFLQYQMCGVGDIATAKLRTVWENLEWPSCLWTHSQEVHGVKVFVQMLSIPVTAVEVWLYIKCTVVNMLAKYEGLFGKVLQQLVCTTEMAIVKQFNLSFAQISNATCSGVIYEEGLLHVPLNILSWIQCLTSFPAPHMITIVDAADVCPDDVNATDRVWTGRWPRGSVCPDDVNVKAS